MICSALYVLAQHKFKAADRDAHLGRYGFGFLWGSFAALLLSVVVFSIGTKKDGSSAGGSGGRFGGSGGRFWRRKSTRSYEGRRVKDEYS